MTETDFNGMKLGPAGAQILGAFMSTQLLRATGKLAKANLLGNEIPPEQAQELIDIMDS
jgi:hypothetical protein